MVINNIKNNFKSKYLNKMVYIETFVTPDLLVKVSNSDSLVFDKIKVSDLTNFGFMILQSDYGDDNNGIVILNQLNIEIR